MRLADITAAIVTLALLASSLVLVILLVLYARESKSAKERARESERRLRVNPTKLDHEGAGPSNGAWHALNC